MKGKPFVYTSPPVDPRMSGRDAKIALRRLAALAANLVCDMSSGYEHGVEMSYKELRRELERLAGE